MEVEAGHCIAVVTPILKPVAGKRLIYRALTSTTDAPPPIGIARASNGDVTPAGENFSKSCGNVYSTEGRRPMELLAGAFIDLFAAKNNLSKDATTYGSCGVLKTPLEQPA